MGGMNTSNTSICLNFFAQLNRAGKFGVSRNWLEELYEDHKGKRPATKTIYRIIDEIELSMSRQAVRIVKRGTGSGTKYFLESDWGCDDTGRSNNFWDMLKKTCLQIIII
ncbi:MAG: hypothetical protein WCP79_14815 [Bacillota bacterium]